MGSGRRVHGGRMYPPGRIAHPEHPVRRWHVCCCGEGRRAVQAGTGESSAGSSVSTSSQPSSQVWLRRHRSVQHCSQSPWPAVRSTTRRKAAPVPPRPRASFSSFTPQSVCLGCVHHPRRDSYGRRQSRTRSTTCAQRSPARCRYSIHNRSISSSARSRGTGRFRRLGSAVRAFWVGGAPALPRAGGSGSTPAVVATASAPCAFATPSRGPLVSQSLALPVLLTAFAPPFRAARRRLALMRVHWGDGGGLNQKNARLGSPKCWQSLARAD